jgi:hypothetical protein
MDMQREFQRMGFRFDDRFFNRIFFGADSIYFNSVFWDAPVRVRVFKYGTSGRRRGGSFQDRPRETRHETAETDSGGAIAGPLSYLVKAGKKVGRFLFNAIGGLLGVSSSDPKSTAGNGTAPDVNYQLSLSPVEAKTGGVVEVEVPHLGQGRRVSVRIPPGVQPGTRLRLKDMGRPLPDHTQNRGDLYIHLRIG